MITIVGGEEVRTYQEHDDGSLFQVLVNGLGPICTRNDLPIMPSRDKPLPFEETQMDLQLSEEGFILMSIRKEQWNWLRRFFSLFHLQILPPIYLNGLLFQLRLAREVSAERYHTGTVPFK